jgi:hypothetical protein
MGWKTPLGFLVLLLASCAGAQQAAPPSTPKESAGLPVLRIVESPLATNAPVRALIGSSQCDADGNTYVRAYDINAPHKSPIIKLHGGEIAATFSASSDPDLQVGEFSVTKSGDVYQVGWTTSSPDSFVLSYSKDGRFKRKTKLEADFDPYQIVGFESGEVLVAGVERSTKERPTGRAFTAIFDTSGRLQKKLTLEEDQQFHEKASLGDSDYVAGDGGTSNRAFTGGIAEAGTDGNVYLLRRTSPAYVYVISSSGNVVRKFTIDPNEPGLFPTTMQVADGSLAVLFHKAESKDTLVVVTDYSGQELARYGVYESLGDAMVCFTPPATFSFFGSNKGKLAFYKAEPR